jgi:Ran GTPase-activating protein (RanGAP) involved in mRNA processing and transport
MGVEPLLSTLAVWDEASPSQLRILDLTSNGLTENAAAWLADALRHNVSLLEGQ